MSLVDCGSVIADEIDAVNRSKYQQIQERLLNGEDLLPNCDLTVWLRDCTKELVEPIAGIKTGEIPKWLNGSLLRNGPGSLGVGDSKFQHLFDGSSLLHRFGIRDGKATYQCRFLQTNTYKRNHAAKRIVVSEFGTQAVPDPCHTIFDRLSSFFTPQEVSDNCMISIYPFADELYTFSEYPVIHRVDPMTIETLKTVDVSNYVSIVHHTSHPHLTPDGTVYNLGLTVTPIGPRYAIVEFPKTKTGEKKPGGDVFEEARIVGSVGARWPLHPGYMHTFGLTDSYFVIVEQPLSVSVAAVLATKFTNKATSSNLKWFPEYNTLIYLVSRSTGSVVQTYYAEPFFYLHIINQYEEDGNVVLDICAYKDPSMIDCMYIEALKSAQSNPDYARMFRGRPVRFVLPVDGSAVELEGARAWRGLEGRLCVSPVPLAQIGCETPRFNYPAYLGKKYTYFYAISSDVDLETPGTLIKVDTVSRTFKTWSEKGTFPSEPIFVPSKDSQDEDDGVVLSAVLWADDPQKVALLVLDAKNFTEIGRTVFTSPGPVPKCLHGWYASRN